MFHGPAKLRPLMALLRVCPPALATEVLAAMAIADGVVRRRRFSRALAWCAAQGFQGWEKWRMASAILANHGRFVAQEAMLGVDGLDDFARRARIVGREHLDRRSGGTILLGFHLGPPRAWLALRALGYPVHFVARKDAGEGQCWDDLIMQHIVVPVPADSPVERAQAMYRLRQLLQEDALVLLTVDGPFGREAFSIDLPGRSFSVRGGWLALRRQTGAAVLPMLVHEEGDQMVIEVHPPLPASDADPTRDAAACRDTLTPLLTDYVRRYPEQCRYLANPPARFESP